MWKVGTHSVSVSGIDIHSKNYTMSLFRRFILSGVGATLLFASGLLVITATPAAVPINSYYGAWSSQVTYPKGSVVTSGGSSYISLLGSATNPNLNHSPLISSKWWAPFDAQGSQGIPGPPGPPGGVVVKDANGTIVGPYIFTAHDNESVAVQTSGGLLIFGLTHSSTSPTGEPLLKLTSGHLAVITYISTDCSGVAYVDPNQFSAIDFSYFRYQLVSGTNFYPVPPSTSATTLVPKNSQGTINGCVLTSGAVSAIPLVNGTPLSTLGFVAPFRILLN